MDRRWFVMTGGVALAGARLGWGQEGFAEACARIEKGAGARLGVAVFDTATGRRWGYRENERFAMCSTFKMMLVVAVLWRADAENTGLGMRVGIPREPLLGNSPMTAPHAGATMTVEELCRAAIVMSDNTAANLLLARVGGPEGYTTFVRAMGDERTRLDRIEPALNESRPGDARDTTTPAAMMANLGRVVLGDVLTLDSRERLLGWMLETQTGLTALRAGMPAGWKVGDKTGSDGVSTRNDVAIVFRAGTPAPVLVSAYLTECAGSDEKRNGVLAEVGKLVAGVVG